MDLKRAIPRAGLRDIVRSFGERRTTLGTTVLIKPLAARPDQIIEIYLAEPYRIRTDDGQLNAAPEIVIVGPQSHRCIQLYMSGQIHVFTIRFHPAGLSRLTGVDMSSLVNQGIMASDVVGNRASLLRDAVLSASDFPSRVAAAERWIGMMREDCAATDGIDHASRLIVATRGRVRIDALVERSGFGASQFQRRFRTQVGLSPKLYARTVRLEAALTARRVEPGKHWTAIIHDAGYFDQAHFIRECRALAGAPPSGFSVDWESARSQEI